MTFDLIQHFRDCQEPPPPDTRAPCPMCGGPADYYPPAADCAPVCGICARRLPNDAVSERRPVLPGYRWTGTDWAALPNRAARPPAVASLGGL